MGLFASLDAELQKDFLDFVREKEAQPGPVITGWAREGNKCWMELTWNFDKNDQEKTEEDGING